LEDCDPRAVVVAEGDKPAVGAECGRASSESWLNTGADAVQRPGVGEVARAAAAGPIAYDK
jgi:hypothetical protein